MNKKELSVFLNPAGLKLFLSFLWITQIIQNINYFIITKGQFLATRTYQGLEPNIGETPVSIAIEGRKGIAKGYSNPEEPESKV